MKIENTNYEQQAHKGTNSDPSVKKKTFNWWKAFKMAICLGKFLCKLISLIDKLVSLIGEYYT